MQEAPNPGITLLFIMLGVILLAMLINWSFSVDKPVKQKELCKLHKWSINPVTKKLQCQECNYVAGTYKTEHGEY